MRGTHHQIQGLVSLHRIERADDRRASFRQGFAALAAMVVSRRKPAPLEGLAADALLESVTVARKDGLFDDLGWLSKAAAGAALFELAAALPESDARRDLGRRVLVLVRAGDAGTFVGIATQLALTSKRALSGPGVQARVSLALELPFAHGIPVDALALSLLSRRELTEEWVVVPSTGSLPSRRLAARVLERAAREAAHRAREHDDSGLRAFRTPEVRDAFGRLLADREPLVYRHVASARGLLAAAMLEHREAIEAALDPTLGPTEWRRGAASLAASVAVRPSRALRECEALLGTDLPRRDPGVVAAMIAGLARPAESDPDSTWPLLVRLLGTEGVETAEALLFFRRELGGHDEAREEVNAVAARLFAAVDCDPTEDDGARALWWSLGRDLQPASRRKPPTLRDLVDRAHAAFVTDGVEAASRAAEAVMGEIEARLAALETLDRTDEAALRKAFVALRELDTALLETDTLSNLLSLRGGDAEAKRPLGDVFERIGAFLLREEGEPPAPGVVAHPTLRMSQLRTLLHLVDADGRYVERRGEVLRERRLATARVLLARVAADRASAFRRAACATCARALDALVREEIAEVVDVLVAAASYAPSHEQLAAMSEASMVPDVRRLLREAATLVASLDQEGRLGSRRALASLVGLADALPAATSTRVEAFRRALLEAHRALEGILEAGILLEVVDGGSGAYLATLEAAGDDLARFGAGAHMRLGLLQEGTVGSGAAIHRLDLAIERTLRGTPQDLATPLAELASVLREELPWPIAELALRILERVPGLPIEGKRKAEATATGVAFKEHVLPAWMPPGRVLGGFHVLRSIGTGTGGTVFVARRLEDRHDEDAARFALKVPDYSGTVARMLSEEEFLRLFREEAGALLSVPDHPNIARFITFDAGARPKPILVMELVEGPELERVLQMGGLSMERGLAILDGVAAGLAAMHGAGVGHLDLKPSNVIVRDPDGLAGPLEADTPVLVDFGLSGRTVRPGCGTAEYGAPEVWNPSLPWEGSTPGAVDVYAFGCMAFEVLTGKLLFDAENEMDVLPLHAAHDGAPPGVMALARDPATLDLAKLLHATLRRSPADRCSAAQARLALERLAPALSRLKWPLLAER